MTYFRLMMAEASGMESDCKEETERVKLIFVKKSEFLHRFEMQSMRNEEKPIYVKLPVLVACQGVSLPLRYICAKHCFVTIGVVSVI